MLQDLTKHLPHYLSLFGVVGASLLGLIYFSYDRGFQAAIAVSLGAAYIVWGIMHHHIHHDLHPKIVLEYIATAALGVGILLSVILRA